MFLPVAMVLNASLTVFILHLSKRDRCGNTAAWLCLCLQGRLHRQAFPDGVLAGSDHQAARPHRLHQDDRRRLGAGRVSARCRGRLGLPETGPMKTLKVKVGSTLWFKESAVDARLFTPEKPLALHFCGSWLYVQQNAWVRLISVHDDTSAIKCNLNIVPITSNFVCPVLSEI